MIKNDKPTLIMTYGLPASGKTTWAKAFVKEHKGSTKRINKDDLRSMLDAGEWSKQNEQLILQIRDELIVKFLRQGLSVIVDDTNLHPKHRIQLSKLAEESNAEFKIEDFTNVSVKQCLERDSLRSNSVGSSVILQMYNQYLKKEIPQVEYDHRLRDCYIFDIDGTLAIKGDRSPYDWKKVGEDTPNRNVAWTLKNLKHGSTPVSIILFSGRDAVCQTETLEWLERYGIEFDDLVMRPEGDMRKDSIVKQEMYEAVIKGKYNVLGIFDDRDQVVEMWRSLGLPCYQVAEGSF